MADSDMPSTSPQRVGDHAAARLDEVPTFPSKYAASGVPTLQDQADNGGWLPHGMPVNGDTPDLMPMGTRGSFKPTPDNEDTKSGGTIHSE
jgi:hypothetical protein